MIGRTVSDEIRYLEKLNHTISFSNVSVTIADKQIRNLHLVQAQYQ